MSLTKRLHSSQIIHSQHDQAELHCSVSGDGSPALLFIHGWTCKRSYWQPQLDYFRQQHAVMSIDLPGHGDSPGSREKHSIAAYATDVLSAAAKLPAPVVLIGHSMGGAVALEAAQQMAEKQLAGVVLADTFLINYGALQADDINAIYQPFADNFTTAMQGLLENCCVEQTPVALVRQLREEMSAADPGFALPVWDSLLNWDPAPAFASIKAPIHAINCPLLADETRQRLSAFMSEDIIAQTGHFLQMDQPDKFNALLAQRLAGWRS